MGLLGRLLGRTAPVTSAATAVAAPGDNAPDDNAPALPRAALNLREDVTWPVPDWAQVTAPEGAEAAALDAFWSSAARGWLLSLRQHLGESYRLQESEHFMLLGPLPDRALRLTLDYAERARRQILTLLQGIARDDGDGKIVILVLEDADRYYSYVSTYAPEMPPDQDALALSGGMFIQHGYGHFVFVADAMDRMEPVIAHELTHGLLTHLPLPAWLNEGIAVNTERRIAPLAVPPTAADLPARQQAFWNAQTIQQFWSGRSWLRPDEGNELSYALSTTFVHVLAQDWAAFVCFANAASYVDAGQAAAVAELSFPLDHLAQVVLGEGDWTPDPARWTVGTERGQFSAALPAPPLSATPPSSASTPHSVRARRR